MLINGIFFFIRYFAQSFLEVFYKSSEKTGKFVYFSGLTKSNLPKSSSDNKSYNIINWYLARNPNDNEINHLCHDVQGLEAIKIGNANIGYLRYPFLPISDFTNFEEKLDYSEREKKYSNWLVSSKEYLINSVNQSRF